MEPAHFNQKDRDTLENLRVTSIKLETKLDRALEDIKGMTNNFASQAELLTVKKDLSDHELRIRRLEVWGFMAIGAFALLEFALKFLIGK